MCLKGVQSVKHGSVTGIDVTSSAALLLMGVQSVTGIDVTFSLVTGIGVTFSAALFLM